MAVASAGRSSHRRASVRASRRSMPRTLWKLPSVAVLPVKVASTSGCKGIARSERLDGFQPRSLRGKRVAGGGPQGAVCLDGWGRLFFVDGLEQAAAQDLNRLVVFGGIQQRRLARGDALGFRHPVGDELVLFVVGVTCPAVLADRQRIDQGGTGERLSIALNSEVKKAVS